MTVMLENLLKRNCGCENACLYDERLIPWHNFSLVDQKEHPNVSSLSRRITRSRSHQIRRMRDISQRANENVFGVLRE